MYLQYTSPWMEVCMEGDDVKGFIYVWDKRFLISNSGWDCSRYSAAYDCSSGADFWQDGASSWWGVIDQMRAEKFSLVKQGQVKSRSHWCIANGICLAVKDQVCIMQIWYCSIFRCFCTGLGCWNVFHTYFFSMCSQCLQVFLCLSSRSWHQEWQAGPRKAQNRIGTYY